MGNQTRAVLGGVTEPGELAEKVTAHFAQNPKGAASSDIRSGGQGDDGSRVDQVAVYGTLRLESVRRDLGLAELVAPGGRCLLPGRLYALGAYPGLVLDGDGGVVAERLTVLDEAAMARLDRYEGHHPHDPEGSLFRRVVLDCLDPPVPVWCYLYNRALGDAPLIASGDWLA